MRTAVASRKTCEHSYRSLRPRLLHRVVSSHCCILRQIIPSVQYLSLWHTHSPHHFARCVRSPPPDRHPLCETDDGGVIRSSPPPGATSTSSHSINSIFSAPSRRVSSPSACRYPTRRSLPARSAPQTLGSVSCGDLRRKFHPGLATNLLELGWECVVVGRSL